MDIHKPKPVHSWRKFLKEIGIIVIGVLIALGGEQMVEALHWHQAVGEFEEGIRYELADTLAAFRYRTDQSACVDRRLAELAQFQHAAQAQRPVTIRATIGQPSNYAMRVGVWMSRSPEVINRLPTQTRLAYASLYDLAQRISDQEAAEAMTWAGINAYVGFASLTPDQQMKLNELLYKARGFASAIAANYATMLGQARLQGIAPAFGARRNVIQPPDPTFCKPLMRAAD